MLVLSQMCFHMKNHLEIHKTRTLLLQERIPLLLYDNIQTYQSTNTGTSNSNGMPWHLHSCSPALSKAIGKIPICFNNRIWHYGTYRGSALCSLRASPWFYKNTKWIQAWGGKFFVLNVIYHYILYSAVVLTHKLCPNINNLNVRLWSWHSCHWFLRGQNFFLNAGSQIQHLT